MLTRAQKEELNKLSLEVFGSSSRWQKLMERGYLEPVTETATEYVPNPEDETKEGTTKEVKIPIFHKGMRLHQLKRATSESVKELMLKIKEQKKMIENALKKINEENKQKVQEATGSSV